MILYLKNRKKKEGALLPLLISGKDISCDAIRNFFV